MYTDTLVFSVIFWLISNGLLDSSSQYGLDRSIDLLPSQLLWVSSLKIVLPSTYWSSQNLEIILATFFFLTLLFYTITKSCPLYVRNVCKNVHISSPQLPHILFMVLPGKSDPLKMDNMKKRFNKNIFKMCDSTSIKKKKKK